MKFSKRMLLYCIILVVVFFVLYKIDFDYRYGGLSDYFVQLLSVSAMVFTIMGIWIAFLYPNALQKIAYPSKVEHADFDDSLSETKRLEGLVGSVLKSSFVVIVILVLSLARVVIEPTLNDYMLVLLVKKILLSIAVLLTWIQLESIFYVMYSNFMFINEIHNKREERERDEDV